VKRIQIRFISLISEKNFKAKRAHPRLHISKDAENYGEEDQSLRWANAERFGRKEAKYYPFGDGEITKWRRVRVPSPSVC
jgi:hypothetical protein